jgi:nicotinamidase-related amidase
VPIIINAPGFYARGKGLSWPSHAKDDILINSIIFDPRDLFLYKPLMRDTTLARLPIQQPVDRQRGPSPSLRDVFIDKAVAHISIDLQNVYCDPDRYPLTAAFTAALAAPVSRFARDMRKSGLKNIWVAHNPYGEKPFVVRNELFGIKPAHKDILIEKQYYDAFENTSLDAALKKDGINTLLLTGAFLDACIISTALSAKKRGYGVYIIEDLTARFDDDICLIKRKIEKFGIRMITEKNIRAAMDSAHPP